MMDSEPHLPSPPRPPKLRKRVFKPSVRPTNAERRYRIRQVALLISQGVEPHAAVDRLAAEQWKVVDPLTKKRYLDATWAFLARARKLSREVLFDASIAARDEVIRQGYLRRKVVVVTAKDAAGNVLRNNDGDPVNVRQFEPDPDLHAIMAALDSKDRLHGILEPESVEAYDAGLGPILDRMSEAIIRFMPDPVGRARLVQALRNAIRPKERMLIDEAPVMVDAKVVDVPGTHQNGTTKGPHNGAAQ